MKAGGIGGFEVQPVYPLALDDEAQGIRTLPFLSDDFIDAVALRGRPGAGARPAHGSHARQRLAVRRADCADRRRRRHGCASSARDVPPGASARAALRHRAGERLLAAFVGPGPAGTADPSRMRDCRGAGGVVRRARRSPARASSCSSSPSRTGMMVKRAAVGAEGFVLDHYDRAAHRAAICERSASALLTAFAPRAAVRDLLRQPRGLRRGLDARLARGVPAAPRLRPDDRTCPRWPSGDAAETADVRHDWGQTLTELFDERFLAPLHEWSARSTARGSGSQNYGMPPASLVEQRARRHLRRRRRSMDAAHGDALGLVGEPRLRASGHVVRDVDVAALARLPRDAARHEGRGGPAFPPGHQSADRSRLAVLAAAARRSPAGGSTPPAHSTTRTRGGS